MTSFLKSIERAYPWLLLSPIILPVVIWGGLIYPYLVPKTLLFYALSLLSLAAFTILSTNGRAFYYARLARKETWIPVALLVLAYVTSYYGVDFYRSFWSIFVRGDGLLMLTCVAVYFYLIVLSADRVFFERLTRSVASVATMVAVYGIGEWLIDGGRIGSLLGNAAFFAGYLGVAFFVTLIAYTSSPHAWKRMLRVGAVLQVIAIVLTATRGTILALGVALLAYLGYTAWRATDTVRLRALQALGAFAVLGVLFFALRADIAKIPFEPISRIATVSTSDSDVSSRLFIWKNMVTEIEKSPWIGVGAEHIDILFNHFYDPTKISEQWFDRSHNAFLDYTAQYGIGGLILYVLLIGSFFIAARRAEKRDALLFSLLAITYAVQNFFVFDTISSFWLFLAMLAVFVARTDTSSSEVLPTPNWKCIAAWPIAAVLVLLIIPCSIQPARAAYDLAQAYDYQIIDVPKSVNDLTHGISLGTYADLEYGYEVYDMYANNQVPRLSGDARAKAYEIARSILTKNYARYDYDGRTALCLAQVLSLAPAGVAVDKGLLSNAITRAITLSQKRSQPWYVLVNTVLSQANSNPIGSTERAAGYAAAKELLVRYIALVPELSEPHFVLAQLLLASGDTAGAALEAAKGKTYYREDLQTAERAVSYYETVLDLPNATFFLQEVLRFDPTNTAAQNDLNKIQAYESKK